MPRGAAVIPRTGKRGMTYSLKFVDAAGKQVWERLGTQAEGWTEKRAQRELGKRLDLVERERWRKPERVMFEQFARRFLEEYLPGRNLKPSTVIDYRLTIGLADVERGRSAKHLAAFFGDSPLTAIEPADVDAYIAEKSKSLSAKTIGNHLGLLRLMFKVAKRWRLVSSNPRLRTSTFPASSGRRGRDRAPAHGLPGTRIRPPEGHRGRMVASHEASCRGRAQHGPTSRRTARAPLARRRVARVTAPRSRGVRPWGVPVAEEPHVAADDRTRPRTGAVLDEQYRQSLYQADDCLVFCHPALGTPLDPSKLSRDYMRPALKRAKITKPFRPWHDLPHTALTHEAAAGNPQAYVQLKAGHSQGSITERYIHAAQVLFPGAAQKAEQRMFGSPTPAPDDRAVQAD